MEEKELNKWKILKDEREVSERISKGELEGEGGIKGVGLEEKVERNFTGGKDYLKEGRKVLGLELEKVERVMEPERERKESKMTEKVTLVGEEIREKSSLKVAS